MIEKIKEILILRREKIAVAESVTAGFLQAALASAESASNFFEGGVTAYNIEQKVKHLQIDRRKAEACNCVSQETAEEMVMGVCRLFDTEWGIAITGYATPVPESNEKRYAYFAIGCRDRVVSSGKLEGTEQEAIEVQLKYVNEILTAFAGSVANRQPGEN